MECPGVAEVPTQVQSDAALSQQVSSTGDQAPDPGAVQLRTQVTVRDDIGRRFQFRVRSFGGVAFVVSHQYLSRPFSVEAQGKDHPLDVGGCVGLHRLKVYGSSFEITQPPVAPGVEADERLR